MMEVGGEAEMINLYLVNRDSRRGLEGRGCKELEEN